MPKKNEPTLAKSADRNTKVDPKRVAVFMKTVQTLRDRGVLQKSGYGITPPFSRSKNKAAQRPVRSMNHQQQAR